MADHDGHRPGLDARLVGGAVGLHPLFAGEVVDRRHQVLVPFVPPVPGEVLDRGGDPVLLHLGDVGPAELPDGLGVGAEGADVGDGVAEVIVDVDDRRERPIAADGLALGAADLAQASGVLHLAGGRHRHRAAEQGTGVGNQPVAALFDVGRHQHRDGGPLV